MNTPNDIPIIPHNIPLYPHYTTIFVGIHHAPSLIHRYVAAFQAAERLASQEGDEPGLDAVGAGDLLNEQGVRWEIWGKTIWKPKFGYFW